MTVLLAEVAATVIACFLGGPCEKRQGFLDNPRQCGLVVRGSLYDNAGDKRRAYTLYSCQR